MSRIGNTVGRGEHRNDAQTRCDVHRLTAIRAAQ